MGSTRLWPEEYRIREEDGGGVDSLRRETLCTTDPGEARELTALGDDIDVGARLADAADLGEIVASLRLCEMIGLATDDLKHRSLELEGKAAPVDGVVITVTWACRDVVDGSSELAS